MLPGGAFASLPSFWDQSALATSPVDAYEDSRANPFVRR